MDPKNKRVSVLVEENDQQKNVKEPDSTVRNRAEKLKKPVIFALMAIVFAGCMYLIFKPSDNKKKMQDTGLNGAVPQATVAGLQPDKQKAYEQEQLELKEQEKRNALASLSDYWNEDSVKDEDGYLPDEERSQTISSGLPDRSNGNTVLNSYRNTQDALNTFYQEDNSQTQELRKKIEELKQQLSDKETTQPSGNIDNQLALMEKSYQMAAKYLPANMGATEQPKAPDAVTLVPITQKESFVAFTPARKNAVSALYREPTDTAFAANLSEIRNRGFYTVGVTAQLMQSKNSIRATVQQTKIITGESSVKLRLLEAAGTPKQIIPEGSVLTANAKFQNGRLELKISSIEIGGNIIPVDITVYDLDGQPGLFVPYSPEMNALSEIAANMSQSSGTSIMMTRSAGQQMAGDLSRGVVQGISGYFSKKIRTPKVTLKAGHQVLLVSK
ncbi:MAG TPA: conjugative transposon protein TraM [Agriterribacter sp.]|uniref:conjugative transposon protein TraM n=1 Tax=Agriterribacter sp. TaxID=2821509 RepID=UPI002D144104|nr:conjugative transposon protein TraM [Agriterribacter sp.]HRQ18291.1 conjugative transposon protein TraM [Agriterribacter sp.]